MPSESSMIFSIHRVPQKNMVEEDLYFLLKDADLVEKENTFVNEGIQKVEHFLDADYQFLIETICLKPIEAKRLIRKLGDKHGIKIDLQPLPSTLRQSSSSVSRLKQSVITTDANEQKRMKLEVPKENPIEELEGWKKYLYPFPKTPRMVFYNEIVPVIYKASFGVVPNFENYMREQMHFRLNCKTVFEKFEQQILFFKGSGSGIDRFIDFKGTPKSHDKKTLEKLISCVSDNESAVVKRKEYLLERRKKLAGNGFLGIKDGFQDEFSFLNLSIEKCEELLAEFTSLLSKLNDTVIALKRSKIQESTKELSARQKRRVKENTRKARKQKAMILENRTKEILFGFFGKELGERFLKDIRDSNNKESVDVLEKMKELFGENLKFKFHYNSLKRIVDSGLFKGDTQDLLRQKLSSLELKQKRKLENRKKVAQDKNQKQKKQSKINIFLAQ